MKGSFRDTNGCEDAGGEAPILVEPVAEPARDATFRDVVSAIQTGKKDEALQLATALVMHDPYSSENHGAMANALLAVRRYEESLLHARRALALDPYDLDAQNVLSQGLMKAGRIEEAKAALDEVLCRAPDSIRERWMRAFANLTLFNFKQGFEDYEYGYLASRRSLRSAPGRMWRGERVGSLLIHGEQGLGDQIQFARYISEAAKRAGGTVLLEVSPQLLGVFENMADKIWAPTSDRSVPVPFDAYISLLSLPHVLGVTEVEGSPYLRPPALDLELDGARVAFCWQGNPDYSEDEDRSLTIEEARRFEGAAPFVLIQVSGEAPFECPRLRGTDLAVTAAILERVDLVVSVDTCIAHLAGAIGKECWLITPRYGDWRWGKDGNRSPWYDSIEVFRCPEGDRTIPIQAIRERLLARFGASTERKREEATV